MLIIFDFDGTLVDLEEMQNAAYDYVLQKRNIDYDMRKVPPGVPITQKINMLREFGYTITDPCQLRQERDKWVIDNVHKYLKYSPDLEGCIKHIAKKHTICIATNASKAYVEKALKILRVEEYIVQLLTSDTYAPKPSPEMFVALKLTYGDGIVYEDSEAGWLAAKEAGMFVVMVEGQKDLINKLRLHYDI